MYGCSGNRLLIFPNIKSLFYYRFLKIELGYQLSKLVHNPWVNLENLTRYSWVNFFMTHIQFDKFALGYILFMGLLLICDD